MASVQDLKRRVRSVRNTRKITKAMELVASARLRRAQTRIEEQIEKFKNSFNIQEERSLVAT